MPHVIVKMYSGRTQEQKSRLAAHIAEGIVRITECGESAVSVAIEEIPAGQWAQKVYRPDILECPGTLYREPGYNPFESCGNGAAGQEGLTAYLRQAEQEAQAGDRTGYYNAMSWLDRELEENPGRFDPFFEKPWDTLSDEEKAKRAGAIRKVL